MLGLMGTNKVPEIRHSASKGGTAWASVFALLHGYNVTRDQYRLEVVLW